MRINLISANLKGAVLDWHIAQDVDLRGAKYNSETIFAKDFEPKAAGMIFEDTD